MTHEPNINAKTYDGRNELMFSALNKNLEITKLLFLNNADCNIHCCNKQYVMETITCYEYPTNILD